MFNYRFTITALFISLSISLLTNARADNEPIKTNYLWGRGINIPSVNLTLGGYINASFEQMNKLKSESTIEDLSLFITWSPFTRLRFFSELELEDIVSDTGINKNLYQSFRIERLYADILASETLTLRLGKFLTPVGRWNVIHAGPLVWTTTRPSITENTYMPEHLTGAMLTKKIELNDYTIDISAYIDKANHIDPRQEEFETDNAFGSRVNIDINEQLQIGLSYLNFKKNIEYIELSRTQNFGFDILWKKNNYELMLEFIYHHTNDVRGDKQGLYMQTIAPLFASLFAVGRYEYLNNHKLIEDVAHIGVLGLAWRPYNPLIIKAEYRLGQHNEYVAPDGVFTSIAVFF